MEALEHTVNDSADVINSSACCDPANNQYKTMFKATEEAGIIVVSTAGNYGNGTNMIGAKLV